MEFDSNLKAQISVSWMHPFKEQKLIVAGELGMLVFDDTLTWNQKLSFYNHKIDFNDTLPILNKADVEYINVDESEPLKNECKHFIDVVNTDAKPLTDGHEGLRALNILNSVNTSPYES